MTEWYPENAFDLGIWGALGWTPKAGEILKDDIPPELPIPPQKKRRLSLSLKKPLASSSNVEVQRENDVQCSNASRFVSPTKSLENQFLL